MAASPGGRPIGRRSGGGDVYVCGVHSRKGGEMTGLRQVGVWCAGSVLVGVLAGCGNSKLGRVEGTVLLDGEPLEGAVVTFYPMHAGAASYGRTDARGHYELRYNRQEMGAEVGKHKVEITTYEEGGDYGPGRKELLPTRYNYETELEVEVQPGRNVIDFLDLTSEGEIEQGSRNY